MGIDYGEQERIVSEIESRWTTKAIQETHWHGCHMDHWTCAISILIEMVREKSWHSGTIIQDQRDEIIRLRESIAKEGTRDAE